MLCDGGDPGNTSRGVASDRGEKAASVDCLHEPVTVSDGGSFRRGPWRGGIDRTHRRRVPPARQGSSDRHQPWTEGCSQGR